MPRASRTPVVALLARALEVHYSLAVPAGVVGQVWRDGRRQARLLGSAQVEIVALDDQGAREAGQLCGVLGVADVIDASAVLYARRRGYRIVTSDPVGIQRLGPAIPVIAV